MVFTESLKENYEFKRLYRRGKTKAAPTVAVYVLPNRRRQNRLGVTVSRKIGCAVVRNRARRRIKESYRLIEHELRPGFDIVVVARGRIRTAEFRRLTRELRQCFAALSATREAGGRPSGAAPSGKDEG